MFVSFLVPSSASISGRPHRYAKFAADVPGNSRVLRVCCIVYQPTIARTLAFPLLNNQMNFHECHRKRRLSFEHRTTIKTAFHKNVAFMNHQLESKTASIDHPSEFIPNVACGAFIFDGPTRKLSKKIQKNAVIHTYWSYIRETQGFAP